MRERERDSERDGWKKQIYIDKERGNTNTSTNNNKSSNNNRNRIETIATTTKTIVEGDVQGQRISRRNNIGTSKTIANIRINKRTGGTSSNNNNIGKRAKTER